MRFVADQAPPHWRGSEWLAAVCEGAGLTLEQAEAAHLVVAGCPWARLAGALSQVMGERMGARRARRRAWQAGVELRRYRADLHAEHWAEARDLLSCLRNTTPCRPPLQVYAEKWGVIDRDAVRFRSRLDGEHPEDLARHPLRFLRDLGRLRKRLAERASGE
jgi:hypothetical protein